MDEQLTDEATVDLTDSPEVRVARGVALLDERVPDWRTRIDVEQLDMTSGMSCVVGQVTRSLDPNVDYPWNDGLFRLGLSEEDGDAHDHGFLTVSDGHMFMDRDGTEALYDLWIKAINRE